MRLATFNLLHGRAVSDGLVDPGRLRASVEALDADVLGMQEVDRGQSRSGGLDLTQVAARAMGAADGDWRFEPALLGTPGGAWRGVTDDDQQPSVDGAGPAPADQPGYGIGLVSRLPVERWHVVRLGAAPVRSPVLMPGTRRLLWLQDEPRVALAAVLRGPDGPFTVATTHLSFVPAWNVLQLRRLVRGLRGLPDPLVLLGDFNLPWRLPGMVTGWTPLARVATYPAPRPRVQFDHALGRGPLPRVVATAARELPVSDHRALVVTLARVPSGLARSAS